MPHKKPRHVVVDGSNIATEGRAMPSLRQLDEAVRAFIAENPDDTITVVVDATFGHRIDPAEVPHFDAAVENNELVTPPAGAIGRGDAFVLIIADKAGATILSNDSFQEFHGDYEWLFEEGRLIGGKPVPNIGWVFVPRVPVRGPVSRRAVRAAKTGRREPGVKVDHRARKASKEASQPLPVPKAPPPRPSVAKAEHPPAHGVHLSAERPAHVKSASVPAAAAAGGEVKLPGRGEMINEALPFLEFVPAHPVGSSVDAVVEAFSSHGAYVRVDGVRCYIPLRWMGDPVPRSARQVLTIGETRTFVVAGFEPARRGIDLALPGFGPAGLVPVAGGPAEAPPAKRARGRTKPVVAAKAVPEVAEKAEVTAPKPKRVAKKAVAPAEPAAATAPSAEAPAKPKRAAKKAAVAVPPAEPAPPTIAVEPAPAPARARRVAKKAEPLEIEPVKTSRAKKAVVPAKAPAPQKAAKKAPEKPVTKEPVTKEPVTKKPAKKAAAAPPAKQTAKPPAAKRTPRKAAEKGT